MNSLVDEFPDVYKGKHSVLKLCPRLMQGFSSVYELENSIRRLFYSLHLLSLSLV